ncbi:dockerin type I repeat-containing protein [Ruminococcus sp.]|uniref:dockerin type I repeat-containing protein n=1 Tax=Ruminococcus sp. TaxID=41978 RepID=UPI0025F8D91A|nr:dockerin type I repeat-containing protein [Ruminococcus sp.]
MKNKRMIAGLTAFAFVFGVAGLLPAEMFEKGAVLTAHAADAEVQHIWDGTADTSWYYREHKVITQMNGNDEVRVAVFDISTPEELAGLGKMVREGNSFENTVINLTADLKLNDTSDFANWKNKAPANNWTPIGEAKLEAPYVAPLLDLGAVNTSFSGVFNGNGHTISGMYCVHENLAGLFGHVEMGIISNVIVKESYVVAKSPQNKSWDTVAGGIVALSRQSVIACCDFDGKVEAYGITHMQNGIHKSCAGGIVGEFKDRTSEVILGELVFMMFGLFVNPLLLMDAADNSISAPGVYCCINRGDIFAADGTDGQGNGAGGIIGTGNHDLCISRCLDLGNVTSENGYVGGIAGNVFNFPMANCYYRGADVGITLRAAGSTEDNAVNYEKAGLSKQEVAEKLGSAFEYADGDIRLVRAADEPAQDDESTTAETDVFTMPEYDFKVTKPAPEVTWEQASLWGTLKDNEVVIRWKGAEGVKNCDIYIYSDPDYTDLLYSQAFTDKIDIVNVRDGVTYYAKLRGRTMDDWNDPACEYTEWSYIKFKLGSIKGDVNDDGEVNVTDLMAVAAHVKAIRPLTDPGIADINGDGDVNVTDLSAIAAHVKGIRAL